MLDMILVCVYGWLWLVVLVWLVVACCGRLCCVVWLCGVVLVWCCRSAGS